MFGYVVVNRAELKPEEEARYRAFYCGLCEALRERHPGIHISCLPAAGEHPRLTRLLASIALEGAVPP